MGCLFISVREMVVGSVTGTGYVSAVKAGTATITAAAGGKSARITVTVTAPSTSGLVLFSFDDGDTTTTSSDYSRQFTAREADGSDFKSVSWTLSDTNAFVFTDWDDGAMGTESTSKTATGRSAIVEGEYDAGTTTLTVKATRTDGTVLTAQKTLVNLGSGTWDNSYWYPADSLSLSGNGLTGTPDNANDDGVYTMTINAGTSTQITTSVTPAKANQHAIWYRLTGEDKDIATIDADGTVYAHKAGTIKYRAYTPSRSVLFTITVK